MDVSNSTGQNTDYRVASGGGPPPVTGKPGNNKELASKLGPNSHHKNLKLPDGTSWHIRFFKPGTKTLLAEAKVKDSSCLIILMGPSKGKFSVMVSKPAKPAEPSEPVKPRQPPSKPPGKKVVGSAAEPGSPMAG